MRKWQQRPARPILVAVLALVWVWLLGALILPDAESRLETDSFAYQRYADANAMVSFVAGDYPPAIARWLRFDEAGQLADAARIFDRATRRELFPEAAAGHWALLFHELGDAGRARAALDFHAGGEVGEAGGEIDRWRARALGDHLAGRAPEEVALRAIRAAYEGEDSALPDWVLLAEWEEDGELRRWLKDRGHRLVRRGLVADAVAVAAVVAGIVGGLWLWLRRRARSSSPPLPRPRLPRTWGGWRFAQEALAGECLGLIGAAIIPLPLFLAGAYDLAVLASGFVFLATPFFWLAWRMAPGLGQAALLFVPELRERHSRRAAEGVAFGLLGFLLLGAGVALSEATGFGIEALGDVVRIDWLDRTQAIVFGFVLAVILAPLFEELVFRGFLFGFLRSRWGPWPAALLSSAIFAAVHGYSGEGLAMVFVYGLVFAWLYQRSGSLLPGIVAHALFNFVVTCQLVGWLSLH